MGNVSAIEKLVIDHFKTLGGNDVLDLGDSYSRLLRPDRATGTVVDHILGACAEVLVVMKVGIARHVNYFTFMRFFQAIEQWIDRPVILETGSSAHGTNSSMLLASLAIARSGEFATVDINAQTVERVRNNLRERHGNASQISCNVGDSVEFISNYTANANVVYLDSYDLNPTEFEESARHGFREFEALLPKLDPKVALILIDDTPSSREIFRKMNSAEYLAAVDKHLQKTGRLPGKGEMILQAIRGDRRFHVLAWEYQLLLLYLPRS